MVRGQKSGAGAKVCGRMPQSQVKLRGSYDLKGDCLVEEFEQQLLQLVRPGGDGSPGIAELTASFGFGVFLCQLHCQGYQLGLARSDEGDEFLGRFFVLVGGKIGLGSGHFVGLRLASIVLLLQR